MSTIRPGHVGGHYRPSTLADLYDTARLVDRMDNIHALSRLVVATEFGSGSGEEAVVAATAAQMLNFYGVPSSVGAGMTDAKTPDYQAGYEKALAIALAAQAGCNNVSEAAGMLGSLMALSFESLVIDNDLLGAVLRSVRGIEVNEETLSFEVIKQVVHGDSHFLRTRQTLELMRSEYEYPTIDAKIRRRFPIRLPREHMQAGSGRW
ncbi:MAG: trimethylamine methyltransferase family protein [Xanthomonadales bacterium]|nr:trimethylamine methyltransferase family protein [Xanthomonadales bacterium]